VALSVSYLGDSNPDVRLLDPDDPPRYLLNLPRLGPADPGAGWRPLGWHRPTDGLAVDAYCCSGFATDPVEIEAVLSVDPATGETDPAIVEGAGLRAALDRTGRFLLLTRISPSDGTGEELFLLERDGELRPIAAGFVEVAW
ncbi:MAG TPA: hypothetical protein VF108_09075, partial [Actinomycetota bacterium]